MPDIQLSNVLVSLILFLLVKLIHRTYVTPLRHIPGPLLNSLTNLPLIYHTALGDYHRYSISLHRRFGPLVRIGPTKVSVSGLAEIRTVLSSHTFRKGQVYEKLRVLPASTFSTTDPELNKLRRRQLGKSYAWPAVRSYEDEVLKHGVLSLMAKWDSNDNNNNNDNNTNNNNNSWVNYHDGFHQMSFNIVGILGLGTEFSASQTNKIIDAQNKALVLGILKATLPLGSKLQWLFRDLVRAREYLIRTARDAITRADGMLIKHVARDPLTKQPLSTDELTAEIALMLTAGTGTTSNTLTWATMCLLYHPKVHKRLASLLRQAFPNKRVIRYADAKTVPYLTAIIFESMRLFPVASGCIPRRVPKACTLGHHYCLPAGTEVCVALAACHRSPEVWSNPDVFDPERFMGPDCDDRIRDVLAFSTGVRICLGRHLAMMELYTVLANIVHKYDFSLPNKDWSVGSLDDVPMRTFVNRTPMYPERDCWMVISPC
ncbi:hypothetical protein GGI25_005150 [Coemansia spiralis]|uniref:Cytochrome P450 n=2 Tax=Coemansia TaxID=4863 RepID=A0A9W8G2T7_9FUNG|nr:cytochrome P450 [Coemansia spiralis]KAJ1988791.1 hypothetical protein EDC05_005082 [Coemansia umbellata]KAJ2620045.1 hypothetical protein GGI26_005339 [Coemansia sp. RSA 1358]KAJ2672388.1 hypothetical protein GGI25_005150 [Coemansia spiralis]